MAEACAQDPPIIALEPELKNPSASILIQPQGAVDHHKHDIVHSTLEDTRDHLRSATILARQSNMVCQQ